MDGEPLHCFGDLIVAMLGLSMLFNKTASQLVILISLHVLLGLMAVPAWTALIGNLVPSSRLGRINATVNLWASVKSILATMASGAVMTAIGGSVREQIIIPIIVATACGLLLSFLLCFTLRRKPIRMVVKR